MIQLIGVYEHFSEGKSEYEPKKAESKEGVVSVEVEAVVEWNVSLKHCLLGVLVLLQILLIFVGH